MGTLQWVKYTWIELHMLYYILELSHSQSDGASMYADSVDSQNRLMDQLWDGRAGGPRPRKEVQNKAHDTACTRGNPTRSVNRRGDIRAPCIQSEVRGVERHVILPGG